MRKLTIIFFIVIILLIGFRPNAQAQTPSAQSEAEQAQQNELNRTVLAAAEAERRASHLDRAIERDEPAEIITADPNRHTRATLTVGTNCTYANLQAAVNASLDGDTILVEGKTFSGSSATVNISNGQAITIIGGYDDSCTTPTATPTTLDATGEGDSVFELYGSTGGTGNFDEVTIRNFNITGGEDDDGFGGGIEINAGYNLTIRDSKISGNSSTFGAGIHISGDATVTISTGAIIKQNTATDAGGGIYCVAADVLVGSGASLGDYFVVPAGNSATNAGGGLYADTGCSFVANGEVEGNVASSGGGVYLTGGSSLSMTAAQNSVIISNQANGGSGGGVYLSAGSSMMQHFGRIIFNTATQNGGGIYATGNGTQVTIKHNIDFSFCAAVPKCVQVSNNTATGNGGGLYLVNGVNGDVQRAYFEHNTAALGAAIYLNRNTTLQTALSVRNVIFGRNNATNKHILRYFGSQLATVDLDLEGLTFAENTDATDNIVEIGVRGNYSTTLRGLIVWGADSQAVYATEAGATAIISDSLLPAGGTFPPSNLVGEDPLFIDPANDDFHIQIGSPATDRYVNGNLIVDIDGETRPARGAAWDAGADEAAGRVGLNGAMCEYVTIGDAINAASNGDTLYISGGVYTELLDEVAKTLTLRAANTDCTIVTDSPDWDVVQIDGEGGSADTIGGLVQITGSNTITFTNISLFNATATFGGILYIDNQATAVLKNSSLSVGSASGKGGCARVVGTLELINSAIYNCATTGNGDGAGVAINGSTAPNSGILIMRNGAIGLNGDDGGNVSADNGGGIFAQAGTIDLYDDSFISYNTANNGNGGGVYLELASQISLHDHTRIHSNLAENGAGIYANGGDPTQHNTVISLNDNALIGGRFEHEGNQTTLPGDGYGGGVYLRGGAWLKIISGDISWNTADYGGGIAAYDGSWVSMESPNAVVQTNAAASEGGGLYLYGVGSILTMTHGLIISNTSQSFSGGISMIGEATATLNNQAAIVGNQAEGASSAGGGVALFSANTRLTMNDQTVVGENRADEGGGIYVADNAELRLRDSAEIRNNHATNGAGLYIINNGILDATGTSTSIQPKIKGNMAASFSGEGGGIYALATSHVDLNQLQIMDNQAAEGGGLFAKDATVNMVNVRFVNNLATQEGGGLRTSNAIINMRADMTAPTRTAASSCDPTSLASEHYCSEFRANQADRGAAIVAVGGTLAISHTAFISQQVSLLTGSMIDLETLSNTTLDTILATDNSAATVIRVVGVIDQVVLHLLNSTIAQNSGNALFSDQEAVLDIQRNIIWDNDRGTLIDNATTLISACNIVQSVETGSQQFTAPDDVNSDPLFVASTRGRYFLDPASPAVDACVGSNSYDLENVGRAKDGDGANSMIEWDMGAFEYDPATVPTVVEMQGGDAMVVNLALVLLPFLILLIMNIYLFSITQTRVR